MINLSTFGLTAQTVADIQIHKPFGSNDRVLLYDGDSACYIETQGVQKLSTSQNRLEKNILTMMFLAKCSSARVHLTPKGCLKNNRHLLLGVKPYQGTRGSAVKPPTLDLLRATAPEYFKDHPDITVFSHYNLEADDMLMQDVYRMSNGVLVSADKDLTISPKEQYYPETGKFISLPDGERYGYLDVKEWMTLSGKAKSKVIGKGTKFFLTQMLMGDGADDVKGILKLGGKLCGEVGAYNLLHPIDCEHEAVNAVLDGYRAIDQNPVPEAEAMWLTRFDGDNSYKYFTSNELTSENKAFLDDCWYNRKWKMTQEEYDELQGLNDEH